MRLGEEVDVEEIQDIVERVLLDPPFINAPRHIFSP
jgi:hypothetical protein